MHNHVCRGRFRQTVKMLGLPWYSTMISFYAVLSQKMITLFKINKNVLHCPVVLVVPCLEPGPISKYISILCLPRDTVTIKHTQIMKTDITYKPNYTCVLNILLI